MGILEPKEGEKKPEPKKRRSTGIDLTTLKPLTSTGTKGFAGYRDGGATSPTKGFPSGKGKQKDEDAMDSDADDEEEQVDNGDVADVKTEDNGLLSPDDALRQGELTEGVRKIKLKRQHSAEPVSKPTPPPPPPTATSASQPDSGRIASLSPPSTSVPTNPTTTSSSAPNSGVPTPALPPADVPLDALIGSPFKKQRASLPGFEEGVRKSLFSRFETNEEETSKTSTVTPSGDMEEDEEL